MDLLEILERPEGQCLEFKRDLSSLAGLVRTAVAFANTAGGIVLLGIEDGTATIVGVSDPLVLEERVASLLSDSITPRLLPDLERSGAQDLPIQPATTGPGRGSKRPEPCCDKL